MRLEATPTGDPGLLIVDVEQHERRMADRQHGGERAAMGVFDHCRPRVGVHMKAQGGGVAREGHHTGRSGLNRQAGPVLGLAGMATPGEVDPRREPFDGRLSADPHKRREGDRQPDHDKNQAGRAERENTDKRNEGCRS